MKKLFLLLLLTAVLAAPQQIDVGTYILNVGKYNIEEGSYLIDFYLWFSSDQPVDHNWEFMNGRATHTTLMIDEPNYKFYRVEAELYTPSDLKNYPIDTQEVSIKIEPGVKTTEELVYVADEAESGISGELRVVGWILGEAKQTISESYFANWDETYSRYTHSITIHRPSSSIFKSLMPFLFIMLSAWLVFFIPIHKLGEKLALGGTALLSAVVYHLYLTEQLPPVGYLTLADSIAIALYGMLVVMLTGLIGIEKLILDKHDKKARKINNLFVWITFISPFIIFVLLQLL